MKAMVDSRKDLELNMLDTGRKGPAGLAITKSE